MAEKKKKTKRYLELQDALAKHNNSLRWFVLPKSFKCVTRVLNRGWYEKTSSGKTKDDNWIHTIKYKEDKTYFVISDSDYLKIINKYKEHNIHLFT